MADSVKVAFVGTGDVFLKYYLPEAIEQDVYDINAICDIEVDRAQKVADFVGGAEAYGDYDTMLEESDAELVVIVTPPMSHYPLALAGLEAGKHVYVEKAFLPSPGIGRPPGQDRARQWRTPDGRTVAPARPAQQDDARDDRRGRYRQGSVRYIASVPARRGNLRLLRPLLPPARVLRHQRPSTPRRERPMPPGTTRRAADRCTTSPFTRSRL